MDLNSRLVVCYASDENYSKLVWCSLKSLLNTNCTYFNEIKVYIISDNITNESKDKLYKLVSDYHQKLYFTEFSDISYGLESADTFQNTKTAYARLFIEKVVSEDKVLYLDCDTIIDGNLFPLWDTNLNNMYVAGVKDLIPPQLRSGVELSLHDDYINSGILLINLKLWREKKLENSFISYINKKNGKVPCHDQGIINHVCKKHIKIIDCKYNTMTPFFYFSSNKIKKLFNLSDYYSNENIKEAINKPVIIHFTAGWELRAWYENSKHPYTFLFKKYYNESPWKNILLKKGKLHKKILFLKLIYKILPFRLYCILVNLKRKSI